MFALRDRQKPEAPFWHGGVPLRCFQSFNRCTAPTCHYLFEITKTTQNSFETMCTICSNNIYSIYSIYMQQKWIEQFPCNTIVYTTKYHYLNITDWRKSTDHHSPECLSLKQRHSCLCCQHWASMSLNDENLCFLHHVCNKKNRHWMSDQTTVNILHLTLSTHDLVSEIFIRVTLNLP